MNRLFPILLFTAAAFTAAAQPTITAITPSNAPAAGGEQITITGTGFSTCEICSPPIPPQVFFGGTPAQSTQLVNSTTLRVIVPAHLPGTASVSVQQHNGFTTSQNAFTFTGEITDAFDRILLPLFTGPVNGAFGSRFITELRLANTSSVEQATLFGLLPVCHLSACIFVNPLEDPYAIEPGGQHMSGHFEHRGDPAAFLYIPKSSPRIEANLRVYDESRSAFNFGTELPVVYDREFTNDPIRLMGVPLDPRFRNTLRIYSTEETAVTVTIGNVSQQVLVAGGRTLIDPAYAQFSNFPIGTGEVDVVITPNTAIPPFPPFQPAKVWAFISVTNNDTQLITTISPQR